MFLLSFKHNTLESQDTRYIQTFGAKKLSQKAMNKDPFPDNKKGRGSIYTDRDYSSGFTSRRSRIIYVSCCMLPYLAMCIYLYLSMSEAVGIMLLAVPLVLFLVFWFLSKKLG